ncbi:MAG: hypothetical protein AB7F99_16320 [Vicinamibacterales bacterium]
MLVQLQGERRLAAEVSVLVDRLAVIVYMLICAVGFGYWFVPSGSPRPVPAAAIQSPHSIAKDEVETQPAPLLGAAAPLAVSFSIGSRAKAAPVVTSSSPELHARLKPLLNRGADVRIAAADFEDAAQFAAVAHAARNTEIPFMLLKHRVLHDGMSLTDAIRSLRPDANAGVEAELAAAEAMVDLASLAR